MNVRSREGVGGSAGLYEDGEFVSLFGEPFRATEVRTIHSSFTTDRLLLTDIEFRPPYAWRTQCHDQPYCSTIVIEGRAWNLQGQHWVEISLPYVFATEALSFIDAAAYTVLEDERGPDHEGETTTLLRAELPNFGEVFYETEKGGDLGGSELVRSTYRDTSLTIQIIRGAASGRVYEATVTIEGPNLKDEAVITYEYGVEVSIEPPTTSFAPGAGRDP